REGAHALRTQSRAALRALTPHAARGVPGGARRAAAARSDPVAARRLPGATPGTVHPRAPGPGEGAGYVDARRARGTRRLGESLAPERGLVAARLIPYETLILLG